MFKVEQLKLPTGQQLDLDIQAGEIHCLRGDSGVGKTRLLRALADLDPCEGRISLDGHDRTDTPAPQWRSQVMLVPARPRWWLPSAGDHMAGDIRRAAAGLLLNGKQINAPAERLSTGESTRLALLRALSREPAVLLLDEPTAALDESAENAVEAMLQEYVVAKPGRCILWVTHSRAQAGRVAQRQWKLTEQALEPVA